MLQTRSTIYYLDSMQTQVITKQLLIMINMLRADLLILGILCKLETTQVNIPTIIT